MGYHLVETDVRKVGCCITVCLRPVLRRMNGSKVVTFPSMKACGNVDV